MKDCLFCKISKKEIESKVLYEDEEFFVFLDRDQSTPGHTLIIPKKHKKDYKELDGKTLEKMFNLANTIGDKLMSALKKTGITLLFNYGDSQEIKHVHLHLLPNFLEKNEEMTLDEVYTILKKYFK